MGSLLLYGVVSLVIAIAIGAGILMLATRMVAGFMPKFLLAAGTFLIAYIAGMAAMWILGMVLGSGTLTSLVALIVLFIVNSAVLNALVKTPSGAQMGFGKAALVTLVQIIIEIVLCVILVVVFGAGIFSMMSAIH
jgi:hypothetical protein